METSSSGLQRFGNCTHPVHFRLTLHGKSRVHSIPIHPAILPKCNWCSNFSGVWDAHLEGNPRRNQSYTPFWFECTKHSRNLQPHHNIHRRCLLYGWNDPGLQNKKNKTRRRIEAVWFQTQQEQGHQNKRRNVRFAEKSLYSKQSESAIEQWRV